MDGTQFNIDKYIWSTKEEYERIKEDIRSIKYLMKSVNCNDPKIAQKVLNSLKNKPNMFKSKAGADFIEGLKIMVASDLPKNKVYMSEIPKKFIAKQENVRANSKNREQIDKMRDYNQYIDLNIPIVSPKNVLYCVLYALFTTLIVVGSLISDKLIITDV